MDKTINSLINDYHHGNKNAANVILRRLNPLIKFTAEKYRDRRIDFDDAYSDCLISTWKAMDKYDPDKNKAKFSTYALQWMKFRIMTVNKSAKVYHRTFQFNFDSMKTNDEGFSDVYGKYDPDYALINERKQEAKKIIIPALKRLCRDNQLVIGELINNYDLSLGAAGKKYGRTKNYVNAAKRRFMQLVREERKESEYAGENDG